MCIIGLSAALFDCIMIYRVFVFPSTMFIGNSRRKWNVYSASISDTFLSTRIIEESLPFASVI